MEGTHDHSLAVRVDDFVLTGAELCGDSPHRGRVGCKQGSSLE